MEETLLLQADFTDISLSLAYSEKTGHLELFFEAMGVPVNPLEEDVQDDDIGLKLIHSRCASSQYKYENGKNILLIKVQAE